MFTADKNLIQARIADKTADSSLKLLKLIPVFYYCLDKALYNQPKTKIWWLQFSLPIIVWARLRAYICVSRRLAMTVWGGEVTEHKI
jgi:hypothetical protein